MRGFPDFPPIWLLAAMAASWGLGQVPFPGFGAWAAWSGAILIGAALLLIIWCALWFLRKRTPIEPHHQPKALIVEGPYRISRNPIYLALVLIALGFALRQPGLWAFGPVPVLFVILDRRFAAVEEALLLETFGDEGRAYLARTKRWL